MYVIIQMKKNLQIWCKFFNTQHYNLFVKIISKFFSFIFIVMSILSLCATGVTLWNKGLICSPLWVIFKKKNYFLSKHPKIIFRTPKLQTPIKPVGNIFWPFPTNRPFPTKWYPCLDISLFCYSCAVHSNLA